MKFLSILFLFGLILQGNTGCAQDDRLKDIVDQERKFMESEIEKDKYEIITLGAGCFWCVEAIFQELRGVKAVVSGFSGGHIKNPAYREVVSGTTGHAEVVQVIFNQEVIPLEKILEVFWSTHDPTTLNRQGADVGTQYRSAIFYHSDRQKELAEKSKKEVATQLWDNPIVTEISPFEKFYEAEEYHQNYYTLNPNQGYCRVVINPKLEKFRERFQDWLID